MGRMNDIRDFGRNRRIVQNLKSDKEGQQHKIEIASVTWISEGEGAAVDMAGRSKRRGNGKKLIAASNCRLKCHYMGRSRKARVKKVEGKKVR